MAAAVLVLLSIQLRPLSLMAGLEQGAGSGCHVLNVTPLSGASGVREEGAGSVGYEVGAFVGYEVAAVGDEFHLHVVGVLLVAGQ